MGLVYARQSTALLVVAGPFVDKTDGSTLLTGLTIGQADIQLSKGGSSFAQTSESSPATSHLGKGRYAIPLTASDTSLVGNLYLAIDMTGALPVDVHIRVLEEAPYDALYTSGSHGPASAATIAEVAHGARNVYYVKPSSAGGSDSNDGRTPDTAFATLAQAASVAVAGDLVIVVYGIYAISGTVTFAAGVRIVGLGAAPLVVGGTLVLGDSCQFENFALTLTSLTTGSSNRIRRCDLAEVTVSGSTEVLFEDCILPDDVTLNNNATFRRCKMVAAFAASIAANKTMRVQECQAERISGTQVEMFDLVASSSRLIAHDSQFVDRMGRNPATGVDIGICIVGGEGEMIAGNCSFKAMTVNEDPEIEEVEPYFELELAGTITAHLQNCSYDLTKVGSGVTLDGGVTYSADYRFIRAEADSEDEHVVLFWRLGPEGERQYVAAPEDVKITVLNADGSTKINAEDMTAIDDTGAFSYVATSTKRIDLGSVLEVIITATIDGETREYHDWAGRDSELGE